MLRVSQFLKLARLEFETQEKMGLPIPVHAIPSITNFIAHLERECELMENQLAGAVIVPDLMNAPHTNIVSLAAFVEKRQGKSTVNPNEPA